MLQFLTWSTGAICASRFVSLRKSGSKWTLIYVDDAIELSESDAQQLMRQLGTGEAPTAETADKPQCWEFDRLDKLKSFQAVKDSQAIAGTSEHSVEVKTTAPDDARLFENLTAGVDVTKRGAEGRMFTAPRLVGQFLRPVVAPVEQFVTWPGGAVRRNEIRHVDVYDDGRAMIQLTSGCASIAVAKEDAASILAQLRAVPTELHA